MEFVGLSSKEVTSALIGNDSEFDRRVIRYDRVVSTSGFMDFHAKVTFPR
jgi:hypothetical protein